MIKTLKSVLKAACENQVYLQRSFSLKTKTHVEAYGKPWDSSVMELLAKIVKG